MRTEEMLGRSRDWRIRGLGRGVERREESKGEWTQFLVAFSSFPGGMGGPLCLAIKDRRVALPCGMWALLLLPLSFEG